MHRKHLTYFLIPFIALTIAGCGSSSTSGNDKVAINQFLDDAKPHATAINNAFAEESNLVTEMSLKRIPYDTFKKSYDQQESTLKKEVQAVSNIDAKDSAKAYKTQYVDLLNQGVTLMQDQENAMKSDGTMDPAKASQIKTELNTFVSKFKDLSQKYGIKQ